MSALFGDILVRNESLDFGFPVLYKTEHLRRLESFSLNSTEFNRGYTLPSLFNCKPDKLVKL